MLRIALASGISKRPALSFNSGTSRMIPSLRGALMASFEGGEVGCGVLAQDGAHLCGKEQQEDSSESHGMIGSGDETLR
jgi:hypothetical protein